MDLTARFRQMLSKMIFLEVKKEAVEEIFKTKLYQSEGIHLPLDAAYLTENLKDTSKLDNIPINNIIEAMCYVLGADESFKYNDIYIYILKSNKSCLLYTKSLIACNIKAKEYEKAYILMKGLIAVEPTEENFEKAILLLEALRQEDKVFKEEEFLIVKRLKDVKDYAFPYFYEAILNKEEGNFELALININDYINKGGENKDEAFALKQLLTNIINYEEGKSIVYEDPKKALKLLIPLLDVYEESPLLYYYIAIAYRVLENYEKAIFYLNQAMDIDSAIVELVNELGLNYACLGDYNRAITYFRKAFEVTRNLEICTNIVMSYINLGKIKEAREHLNIAKKINSEDEIVIQLEQILGEDVKWN